MKKEDDVEHRASTWGPWLFGVVAIGLLVFFWWMVIFDHGVASNH